MVFLPSARAACRNSNSARQTPLSYGLLVCVSAALCAGASETIRAQSKGKSTPIELGKTTIATANWFGESPGEDFTLTAVCVKDDGSYICLTPPNSDEKNHLTLTIEGIERESDILSIDPLSGICLAKANISETTEPVPLSTTGKLAPGSEMLPLNNDETARLAGVDREYLGEALPIGMLRVHLSENRSDCAGNPLFFPSGELAGLLTDRKLSDVHQAHAVPASRISKIISNFENNKETGRIWIGATFHRQSTTPEVVTVTPDSPAEEAGLQPGDVVMKVGTTTVSSLPELATACEMMVKGEPINLSILRHLEVLDCKLVPNSPKPKIADSEKK